MTRLTIVAFVQWCFCVNFCFAQDVKLYGNITDKSTHEAIEFANVYLTNTSVKSYTNKDGSFCFSDLNTGTYELCVSCIGYHPMKYPIVIKAGKYDINLALTPSVKSLSAIVVTGTGTRYKIEDVPVQTEIISAKSIEEISGRNVEEIISSLSSSFDYTSSSMGSYIKMNGLGKDYVLVLINGKRLTGGIGGRVDLSRINSEDIEQIEIVKGASSTLYGSDAISGVINIITKKSKSKISVSNSTRLGAYNDLKQFNILSYNKGKLAGKTSISYKRNDGYQLNHMKYNSKWDSNHDLPFLVETYDMPVNKKKSYTIIQSLEYDVNKYLALNTEVSWYEKTLFFPFKGRMHNYYYNNKSASVGGKYKFKNKDFLSFSLDYGNYKYYNKYPYKFNESYFTKDGGVIKETYYPGDHFKNSEQQNITALIKGVFVIDKRHTLNSGFEYMGDYLEAKYRLINDDAHSYTASLYIQDEYKINRSITVVGGIRFIHHNKYGTIATPKVSAMFKMANFTNRVSYANGFKSPTLKELYYYYASKRMGMYRLYLGNEDLKPQKSNYYAISSEFNLKKFSCNLSVYVNRLKDMIDYKIIPTQYDHERRGIEETKLRYNIHEVQSAGFDWTFNASLFSGFTLAGGYSYVGARNVTQRIRLNGVSEHSATLKATWVKGWEQYKLNMSLSAKYKSDKFYLEEDLKRTYADPYQLWKLTTSHYFTKWENMDVSFIAGIDNIFDYVDDRPYGSHYGTLNPGRTLFVGVNIKFSKDNSNKK